MGRCQKMPKFDFQSQFSFSKIIGIHSLRLGTEKGQRKFWEQRISMICLCSKLPHFWADSEYLGKLILKKIQISFSMFSLAYWTLKVLVLKICALLFRSVSTTDVGDCGIFLNLFIFIEEYQLRSSFFVIDIFWKHYF